MCISYMSPHVLIVILFFFIFCLQIEYYYHCGVCNLLTIHISDHINTETHKQSLMHAVNKALAIINKNLDNIESANDETKAEVINGPTVDSPVDTAAVIANEADRINAPINSSVDNKIINKTNKDSPVKMNSPNKIRNLAVPSPDSTKSQNNKTSKKPFPNLSPVKRNVPVKAFKLTPDAFPNLRSNGITMNPITNSAENPESKSDTDLNPNSNLTENSASKTTSDVEQNASKLLDNKVDNQNTFSYASAAKKVVNQNPEFVYHEYKDRTVKAKYDSWHMLLKRRNKTFYCMACTETNINDKMQHCSSTKHVQNLDKCTIVNAYEIFLLERSVINFSIAATATTFNIHPT
ncbi:hypothetical protein O3G_MSEX000294 [Manduca sexta]|nr:hypothetical protein O3G_MSEX000294 [Manduca sexta]